LNKSLLLAARAALFGCAIITAVYAFAPPGSGRHLFPWDKADHFASFFAITAAAVVALPRVRLVWIALFVSAAGGAIELIQGLPGVGRDCDVWDWVAENAAIGAVIGLVIAAEVRRRLAGAANGEARP
jgi:VanZ family protein